MSDKQNAWATRPHDRQAHAEIGLHYRMSVSANPMCGLCFGYWPCEGAMQQIRAAKYIADNTWFSPDLKAQ